MQENSENDGILDYNHKFIIVLYAYRYQHAEFIEGHFSDTFHCIDYIVIVAPEKFMSRQFLDIYLRIQSAITAFWDNKEWYSLLTRNGSVDDNANSIGVRIQ